MYEILAEVTRRYVVGETLEPPSLETQQWLRATEELFFRDPPLYHITGITSQFRPDSRIVYVTSPDPSLALTYVSVALGSPPPAASARRRADLHKLVVQFHDCVVARHGSP